jgi:hypothetical protein
MTSFSNSPKVLKGAIVGFDLYNPLASIAVFQYNPDTVTRSLQVQSSGDGGDRSEAMRLKAPPIETIKMEVEIDATDQLETTDGITTTLGIYPQLSALEMLVYPKSLFVITNAIALALGKVEILPPLAPITLLVWGLKRVVPVRLTEISITEEAYDQSLNPIRAKVALGLRVLSYNDLSGTDPGYYIYLANQVAKEGFASIGSVRNLSSVLGSDVKLF